MSAAPSADVRAQFGEIDIYLFDQILRGRLDHRRRILDAGCGSGRNLVFFLRNGFDVHGIDEDDGAVRSVQQLAAALGASMPADRVRSGALDALPWPDSSFDAVICSAVLHFARDAGHFDLMLEEMWRVLAPGGLFFGRLATSIGLEHRLAATTGRMRLPDGSTRFVADEAMLLERTSRLGATLADPLKTTNVQNARCMTTWVLEK